jgi:inorganic pyrophosphatase
MTQGMTQGPTEEAAGMADELIEVMIEIPRGSRNKYEYDHEQHVMKLDRRLFSAMVYPADYGFVPDTLAEDDDPLDAMVLLEEPTFPGCMVRGRPVGVFWMEDEAGPDAKIICVPDFGPTWANMQDLDDLPEHLLNEIEHFFDTYKDLEANKHSSTRGYGHRDEAWRLIHESRERYKPATG